MSDEGRFLFGLAGCMCVFTLGLWTGVRLYTPQPWEVAQRHCQADGFSSGWYDAQAGRIRCVTITEGR